MQQKLQVTAMLALFVVALWTSSASAECNVCSATSPFACVQTNASRFCLNGMPTGDILYCSPGQVCDFDGECRNEKDAIDPSCTECNLCNAEKVFACLSEFEFALCLGNDFPSDVTGTCEEGYVCNLGSPNICASSSNGATCPASLEPPAPETTPSPINTPDQFCAHVAVESRYPVGTDLATTCHQYISCRNTTRGWVGGLYLCPGEAYFHDNSIGCSMEEPGRCSPGVRSLNFHF